ncbi:MAG: hypothetical protein JNL19_06585 [Burkholderiales bacterium]|nr:hypothetical protein [Burkholderiales bacterium]
MLTLRIWLPSAFDTRKLGFASIEVDGGAGGAYMSVRPIKQEANGQMQPRTARLADDVEAEGADNHPRAWRFERMKEFRVLRLWDQFKGLAVNGFRDDATRNAFHFCDMLLIAGQGIDIDPFSPASFTTHARSAAILSTLATNASILSAHANEYLKVRHW